MEDLVIKGNTNSPQQNVEVQEMNVMQRLMNPGPAAPPPGIHHPLPLNQFSNVNPTVQTRPLQLHNVMGKFILYFCISDIQDINKENIFQKENITFSSFFLLLLFFSSSYWKS